jgi:hypothetical protein
MTETGKFQTRVALAGLVAIPIAASSAGVPQGDEAEAVSVCRGCSGASGFAADTPGECGTWWCAACIDLSIDTHPAARAALPFDCVTEDDGEP